MICCAKCGFLTVRNPETKSLEEVDEEAREKGFFPSVNLGPMMLGLTPRCSRMAADLGEECNKAAKEDREADSKKEVDGIRIYLAVITKERDCPAFTNWHPGFSPKEHREMLLDLERKKLEIQDKENERRWQEEREQRQRRFQLANTLISAVAGALCTAIIGGFISGRWSGKSETKPNNPQPTQIKKHDTNTSQEK